MQACDFRGLVFSALVLAAAGPGSAAGSALAKVRTLQTSASGSGTDFIPVLGGQLHRQRHGKRHARLRHLSGWRNADRPDQFHGHDHDRLRGRYVDPIGNRDRHWHLHVHIDAHGSKRNWPIQRSDGIIDAHGHGYPNFGPTDQGPDVYSHGNHHPEASPQEAAPAVTRTVRTREARTTEHDRRCIGRPTRLLGLLRPAHCRTSINAEESLHYLFRLR